MVLKTLFFFPRSRLANEGPSWSCHYTTLIGTQLKSHVTLKAEKLGFPLAFLHNFPLAAVFTCRDVL